MSEKQYIFGHNISRQFIYLHFCLIFFILLLQCLSFSFLFLIKYILLSIRTCVSLNMYFSLTFFSIFRPSDYCDFHVLISSRCLESYSMISFIAVFFTLNIANYDRPRSTIKVKYFIRWNLV